MLHSGVTLRQHFSISFFNRCEISFTGITQNVLHPWVSQIGLGLLIMERGCVDGLKL